MEYFLPDGHLSDEALAALAAGAELDPLARLELSEHLAFCDFCLQRYTTLLTEDTLLAPAHSCRESLWDRVRSRALRALTSRYATAAAAVALALTMLWGSGQNTPLFDRPGSLSQVGDAMTETFRAWPERWNDSLGDAFSGLSGLWDNFGGHRPQTNQGGTNL